MKRIMKEVDVIAAFDTEGKITPVKFRIEEEGLCRTIKIDRVSCQTTERFAGNSVVVFECVTLLDDTERNLQLKYELKTCKWFLYKM